MLCCLSFMLLNGWRIVFVDELNEIAFTLVLAKYPSNSIHYCTPYANNSALHCGCVHV